MITGIIIGGMITGIIVNDYRNNHRRCCRRRRARPQSKEGGRPWSWWWGDGFVKDFSGGMFGKGKGDVLDFGGVFGVCGGLNGEGGGRR